MPSTSDPYEQHSATTPTSMLRHQHTQHATSALTNYFNTFAAAAVAANVEAQVAGVNYPSWMQRHTTTKIPSGAGTNSKFVCVFIASKCVKGGSGPYADLLPYARCVHVPFVGEGQV